MSETYGQKANVGICFQDSYGTSNVDSMHWMQFVSEDITLKKEPLKSQNMRGIFEEGDAYEGINTVEGSMEMEAHPISIGVLLTAAFGEPVSVASDAIYKHTWKPSTTDFDEFSAGIPFTLYKYLNDTGSAFLYYDLCGSSIELMVANGEFLKSTLSVTGGNFTQVADIAASYPGGKRWTWDVGSVSFGGTGQTGLMELSVTVDDGVEPFHTINASRGKFPSRVKHGGWRTIEVSGTMKFDNQTEMQEFLAWTERELIASFVGPTEIQSGYYEVLEIVLPAMQYTDYPPSAAGPGLMEVGFTANGNYDVGSATAFEISLINTLAAYR